MVATAGHRLTLNPMGKYLNAFFSETTNMIKAKKSLSATNQVELSMPNVKDLLFTNNKKVTHIARLEFAGFLKV
jgi:hypothetical protein